MAHQGASRGSKWRSKTSFRKQIENGRLMAGHGGGVARARLRGGSHTDSDSGGFCIGSETANITPDPDTCGNPTTVPCIDLSINLSVEPCIDLSWNPIFLMLFINRSYLLGSILIQFVVLEWPWDAFVAPLGP